MKILTIINSLGTGGAEKLIADMLPHFKEKGHTSDLLLLSNDVNSIFTPQVERMGIKIIYSPHSMYSFKNILFIRRLLKGYDIGHVHLFPAQYWTALTFCSTPIVITEHCTTNRRRSNIFFWPIERITYGRFKKIVTISEKAQATLKSWLKLSKNKFQVIHNGINLDVFYNAKSKMIEGIPINSKKVIMIGRFNPTKDQPTAIKAMSLLPDNYHLLLVGDGTLKEDCEELSKRINVSDRVHFLGKRSDIPELLKSCDLNLISSHSEGLSISSLEALASGKPLICSNVPGLREINSDIGLMFEDNNFKELSEQIHRIINDKELYNKVVEKSLEKVASYSILKTAENHIELYQSILKS